MSDYHPEDPPCPPPKTTPWFLSKRVLCLTTMLAARLLPMFWRDVAAQTISDWLMNLAGIGLGSLVLKDSGTRITLHDERPEDPPIKTQNP